ncbi:MAG: metal ABC transporter permease, partial [bacterium]
MEAFWTYPFMQRALIGAVLVSVVCSCLGVFVILRKLTFLSDAVAHATFTGIALGLLLKADPLFTGLLFSVLGAISLIYLMETTDLALDTLIGVYFSAAVATGIVLLRFSPHYQSEVLERLFGSILGISWSDLAIHAALTVLVLVVLF